MRGGLSLTETGSHTRVLESKSTDCAGPGLGKECVGGVRQMGVRWAVCSASYMQRDGKNLFHLCSDVKWDGDTPKLGGGVSQLPRCGQTVWGSVSLTHTHTRNLSSWLISEASKHPDLMALWALAWVKGFGGVCVGGRGGGVVSIPVFQLSLRPPLVRSSNDSWFLCFLTADKMCSPCGEINVEQRRTFK